MNVKNGIRLIPCVFILMFFFFSVSAFANDIVIIGNNDVSVDSLNPNDVKLIFLGKKKSWENGSKITFATLSERDVHQGFLKKFIKKSPSQYKIYWKKLVFTGKGTAPKSYDKENGIIDFVAATPGAVGYIGSESAPVAQGKVKILQ